MKKNKKVFIECNYCSALVQIKNYKKHLQCNHPNEYSKIFKNCGDFNSEINLYIDRTHVMCEFCKSWIKRINYSKHKLKQHKNEYKEEFLVLSDKLKNESTNFTTNNFAINKKFVLKNSRYINVGEGFCEKCLAKCKNLKKFQTLDGYICICGYCSDIELQETFGSIDILNRAISGQRPPR